jgi:hypothetical protein
LLLGLDIAADDLAARKIGAPGEQRIATEYADLEQLDAAKTQMPEEDVVAGAVGVLPRPLLVGSEEGEKPRQGQEREGKHLGDAPPHVIGGAPPRRRRRDASCNVTHRARPLPLRKR